MVRVHLIGRLAVEIDGTEVDLPPGRPTELLAWLAAHPGLHARSTVAPSLWPDISDSACRASLRTALWTLRKSLGTACDSVLVADRTHVGLEGDDLWVDLRHVRRDAAPDDVLAVPVDRLLPGVEAEWADAVREEHRRNAVEMLEAVEDDAEAAGDHDLALAAIRRLVEIDPYSESLHRRLMRRLHTGGDTAAALKEHEEFRARLWSDLGARPSTVTADLVRTIATTRESAPADPELPSRLARAGSPLFVGRETECDTVLAAWRRARDGHGPQIVLVNGEPGIGKTCLAARVAADVFAEGTAVFYGAAAEDALLPAEPFLEAVGEDGTLPAEQVAELVRRRIEGPARDHPLLLVLDDFHWADRVSFALLRRMARAEAASRLAVLVLARSDPDTRGKFATLVAEAGREREITSVSLEPLTPEATSVLLSGLDPDGSLGARAGRVHGDTGGNPLFVHELGRHLLERGHDADSPSPLPPTVRDLVTGRVQRLSPPAQDAVAGAAVLGAEIDLGVLRHMTTTGGDPLEGLEEAVAVALLEEQAAGVHRFRHALVRDAVYEGLSKSRRAELHRRAADAIRAVRGDDDGAHLCDIAEHRCAATPPDSPAAAVAEARRAAAWAVANHAYERAIVVLTKALAVADPPHRRDLTVARAAAFQRLTHAFIDPVPA